MKKKLLSAIILMIACITASAQSTSSDGTRITQEEALEILMEHFPYENGNYYFIGFHSLVNQTLDYFVDPEPDKGWEHTAYIVTIPSLKRTLFYQKSRLSQCPQAGI